jgi:hypothetical protein
MVKKALMIGINYPNSPFPLKGCIHDIERTAHILTTKYGYRPEHIVSLRDDSPDSAKQPTRENILKQLYAITHDKTPGLSEIWIHYSGHGSQVRDTSGDEQDGKDEVLVPSDYLAKGMILDDEISNMVKDVACPTILIIDACHSGSMCDLTYGVSVDVPRRRFNRFQNSTRVLSNPHILSISGCGDTQTSADAYNPELKKGVGAFTDAFLYTLNHYQYKGSLMFIYQETCRLLYSRQFTQLPVLSSSGPQINYVFSPAQLVFS